MQHKLNCKIISHSSSAVCNLLTFLLALTVLAGCGIKTSGGPKQYVRKSANFQFIKKVAVLPFNNLSDDRYASEKIKNAVMMEVLERGVFDVAEEGEVNKVIAEVFREMGFREGELVSLDIETLQRISERLGIQALFIGTVESYGISRGGRTPHSVVSIFMRMVEAKSGLTLWQATHSVRGSSLFRTIFGLAQKDELALSREVAKQLMDTLFGG